MFSIFRRKKSGDGLEATAIQPSEDKDLDPLENRLHRTRSSLQKLFAILDHAKVIDDLLIEEIETALLMADMGVEVTDLIITRLKAGVEQSLIKTPSEVLPAVQAELFELIEPCESFMRIDETKKPYVVLMVGVNGVGKTTTIGKLAKRLKDEGKAVMLAAGDTFRAAAVEQLKVWGERNDIPVMAQDTGADAAAVIYDALHSATARGMDVLICDTAGRLHTQDNLMKELEKLARVMKKIDPTAPHEVLLVVDGTTGQNALKQAREFNEAIPLTGLVITKLDGTARGGVVFALAKHLNLPIRFIGVGESAKDLRPFDAGTFIHALLPLAPDH